MIIYFSGTGNSRAVATELGRLLDEEVKAMTPSMRGGDMAMTDSRRLIWAFPVYSWGVPPYVLDIIRSVVIDAPAAMPHHAVMTCGDDCGLTDRMWRKAIAARGWRGRCVMSVQMPNNYVSLPGFDVDPKGVEEAKLAAFPSRLKSVAAEIVRAESDDSEVTDIVRGSFARIKTKVIYPWFVRHAMDPRRFSVSEACVACGKCALTCPLGNITMSGSGENPRAMRPAWGGDCAGCLGCYHTCPVHAINYTSATKGKGQYEYRGGDTEGQKSHKKQKF